MDSSKEEDHISHVGRKESIIVGRHKNHSPRHSVANEGSSQIISPVIQHKRKTRVE
jgi:hypothetical protein